jgi:hypothetical protein
MIPRQPDHSQPDPPKDPEVQGWFRALGPPPVGQGSPALRAHVRARIAQEQGRLSIWTWLVRRTVPAWTAVVAVGLLLALGAQVWHGWQQQGQPLLPGAHQATPTALDVLGAARRLHTYRFQVGLPHAATLGTLVAARPVLSAPPPAIGFTPQATRAAFVRIGVSFAEAVATLHGGAVEATAPRLDVLLQTLATVQAPPTLTQYLHVMQTLLHSQQYPGDALASFLSLFEPLYEDAYTQTSGEEVRLFRVGTWVENMALAAAVGAPTALRQEGQASAEVRRVLTLMQAPPGVLDALAQIDQLLRQPTLTAEDISTIHRLLQHLQQMLGV